jgi:two-component system cell cycle response regulator DivK
VTGVAEFTILVIDDDLDVLDTVAELLEADGYAILKAASGMEGLRLCKAQRPHLVLMDFTMPDMDGVATVQKLKADPDTREIPVVALSGAIGPDINELMRAGGLGYIPKPIDPVTFSRLVARFLQATVARRGHSRSGR